MAIETPTPEEVVGEVEPDLPYPGPALTKYLLDLQNSHPIEASEETRKKFEVLFEKLPDFAERLTRDYYQILAGNGRVPGEVRLYMVGGRVKGQPLKDTSDVDLYIAVENPKQGAEKPLFDRFPGDVVSAISETKSLRDEVLRRVAEESANLGIANEFQILNFGRGFPQNERGGLLIGRFQPNRGPEPAPKPD